MWKGWCSDMKNAVGREIPEQIGNYVVRPYTGAYDGVPSSTPVQVSTCPYSMYGAWVGGSMLCSLSTFKDMWVTIEEYREMGFSVVGRRTL